MPRYFFRLAYNGTAFHGWQRQPKASSIQETIEHALTKLNSNEPIAIVGCGRTDAGVHASDYYFHVDLTESWDTVQTVFKLNRMLPDGIAIYEMFEVNQELHARFDATKRTYRYFITRKKTPFKADQTWHFIQELNLEKMNEAAFLLVGQKDFTSFSKLHTDVKTNICEVYHAHWTHENDLLQFEISANRFLRNMVRAVVGTLVDVGLGKLEPQAIISILKAKDRQEASVSVPAQGLFLWKIEYDF